ncbi:hypothetical protein HYV43_05685 [Candidatus Micrarchaeota archaeon]|nr:hypothetical protein [Candidatus Micrarchaeota archaeon]
MTKNPLRLTQTIASTGGEKKWTPTQWAKALEEFPKWGVIHVDSDKDYEEEMDSRKPKIAY